MNQIELSAGTIDYQDTGGDGPTLVLLHGLLMDASLWDDVIADLSVDHRCVAPTLPLGAGHRARLLLVRVPSALRCRTRPVARRTWTVSRRISRCCTTGLIQRATREPLAGV
jgi:pimeloyl-ACP methyl ester carboxylesterase